MPTHLDRYPAYDDDPLRLQDSQRRWTLVVSGIFAILILLLFVFLR